MAHDPTRAWPLGIGPDQTAIPGAAWLELLDGQAFPVVGAGAMIWNGTMWVPVSTQNRLPVDAAVSGTVDVSDRADRQLGKVTLTGQIVEEYNGGTVLRTKTEALAYRVLRPFGPSDTSTVTIPAGGIVAQTADPFEVNGFSSLGIICRDVRSGAAANNDFQVDVYWAGYNTRLTSRAVNEIIAPNSGIGVAVSLPTKSRYVWLRIRNESAEDITYYCAAFLRA